MSEEAKVLKFPKKKKPRKAATKRVAPEPKISIKEIITITLGVIIADIIFELAKHLLHF